MSKWTQEQRDKAALEVELAYLAMPLTQDWPAERVKGVAIACQRNELLEALKNLASLAKDTIPILLIAACIVLALFVGTVALGIYGVICVIAQVVRECKRVAQERDKP